MTTSPHLIGLDALVRKSLLVAPHTRRSWECARYEYRKVLMHTTNPDHLVPSTPSLTDIPPLPVVDRYRPQQDASRLLDL